MLLKQAPTIPTSKNNTHKNAAHPLLIPSF